MPGSEFNIHGYTGTRQELVEQWSDQEYSERSNLVNQLCTFYFMVHGSRI